MSSTRTRDTALFDKVGTVMLAARHELHPTEIPESTPCVGTLLYDGRFGLSAVYRTQSKLKSVGMGQSPKYIDQKGLAQETP